MIEARFIVTSSTTALFKTCDALLIKTSLICIIKELVSL